MKTAISLPDADAERIDRVAARQGLTRSEFYRVAALRYADLLEGSAELTRLANAAIDRAGQPVDDQFLANASRVIRSVDW